MELKLFRKKAGSVGIWSRTGADENRETVRVAVCGASRGAGVSFICGILAAELSSSHRVTVAELGKPYFYTALGMEKRFASRPFAFYSSLIENGKSLKSVYNVGESINWAVRHPRDTGAMEAASLFRCFANIPGEIIVFDCSGLEPDLAKSVMAEADCRIVVIDPMPSALFDAFAFLEDVRLRFPDSVIAVNKMNDGVHRGELSRFLGSKECVSIPFVTPELLYKAEYNCMLPYSVPGIFEETSEAAGRLAEKITKKSLN